MIPLLATVAFAEPQAAGYVLQGMAADFPNISASSNDGSAEPIECFNGISESGNNSDAWISEDGVGDGPNVNGQCWLQWEFPGEREVLAVRMCRRAGTAINFPKDIVLKASDTGAFSGEEVTVGSMTLADVSANSWTNWYTLSNPSSKKYLRIEIHSMYDDGVYDWVAIQEVEFKVTTMPCLTGNLAYLQGNASYASYISADSNYSGSYTAPEGFDGGETYTNRWLSGASVDGSGYCNTWWQIDWQTAKRIVQIRFRAYAVTTPRDFEVFGSNTGAFSGEEVSLGSFTDYETNDYGGGYFDCPWVELNSPIAYRYLRIQITRTVATVAGFTEVYFKECQAA